MIENKIVLFGARAEWINRQLKACKKVVWHSGVMSILVSAADSVSWFWEHDTDWVIGCQEMPCFAAFLKFDMSLGESTLQKQYGKIGPTLLDMLPLHIMRYFGREDWRAPWWVTLDHCLNLRLLCQCHLFSFGLTLVPNMGCVGIGGTRLPSSGWCLALPIRQWWHRIDSLPH